MTLEDEVQIYRDFLHQIHYAQIGMNGKRIGELLGRVANWGYARTNSNGDPEQEARFQEQTLKNLTQD
jgi:hypothetical protein